MVKHTLLVLNAGSSSLKFAVFEANGAALARIAEGAVVGIGTAPRFSNSYVLDEPKGRRVGKHAAPIRGVALGTGRIDPKTDHAGALETVLEWLARQSIEVENLAGVGHRIVHGGAQFTRPIQVDPADLAALDQLTALAPLHNTFGLGAIRALLARAPGVPQIACFDTAFHATQPDIATRLALPDPLHDEGYRRYGFHGLNYEHVVAALPGLTGNPLPCRLLILHLGNGASIAAVRDGACVATTMGYSTLDGLVMGTRSGGIDPGVLIALMRDKALSVDQIEDMLYRRSGLLALSGRTSDMRALLAADDESSARAVAHFCYWAARHTASLVAALGGLDAVVFTGGIGANAAAVRAGIIAHLEWLGLRLHAKANACDAPVISAAKAKCPLYIVPADEELAIARHTLVAVMSPTNALS